MSVGASDTYEVIFEVRDSPMAAAIEKSVADARRLDAQWQSTINNMRQRTAALGEAAGQNLPKTQGMFGNLGKTAADAGSQITRMAATFLVFQAGRELVSGMRDALVDLRDYTVTINKELTGMQSNIAELQSITGRAGETNTAVIQEHLDLMKYSGMSSQQAMKFAASFTGEAEISKEKYDPTQYAMIQKNAARFAMIHGGDAATHAVLAGRLAGMAPRGTTAEEIARQQADLYARLNLAPGETEPLTANFVAELGKLVSPTGKGGLVGSKEALANMYVAAAKTAGDPGAVGTRIEQFSRAMTGLSRSKDWTKTLREEWKIPEGTRADEAMDRVFEELEKVQAKGGNIPLYLKSKGMTNSQEILAVSGMFEGRELYQHMTGKGLPKGKGFQSLTSEQAQEVLRKPYTIGGGRLDLLQGQNEAAKTAVRIEQAQRDQLAEVFRGRAEAELLRRKEIGPEWLATLTPTERTEMYTQEKMFGPEIIQQTKIAKLAMQMAKGEFGMKSRGEAEFIPQGRTIADQMAMSLGLDRLIPGMDKNKTEYIDFSYVRGGRLSQDINEMAEAKSLGYDAATGKELAHPKVIKVLEDIHHGVRKDRPMTVAKPAPGVRP